MFSNACGLFETVKWYRQDVVMLTGFHGGTTLLLSMEAHHITVLTHMCVPYA
jgi:hypothetical protein